MCNHTVPHCRWSTAVARATSQREGGSGKAPARNEGNHKAANRGTEISMLCFPTQVQLQRFRSAHIKVDSSSATCRLVAFLFFIAAARREARPDMLAAIKQKLRSTFPSTIAPSPPQSSHRSHLDFPSAGSSPSSCSSCLTREFRLVLTAGQAFSFAHPKMRY